MSAHRMGGLVVDLVAVGVGILLALPFFMVLASPFVIGF